MSIGISQGNCSNSSAPYICMISFQPSGSSNSTFFRLKQSEKVFLPIYSTLAGIMTVSSEVQPTYISSESVRVFSGKTTLSEAMLYNAGELKKLGRVDNRDSFLDNNSIERVFLLCFDANNTLITYRMIGEGDVSSSNFDMRKIASTVLETNAASVVLSHNHPHGISAPSYQDGEATAAIASLLNTLNVKFADHIIVTDKDHFSMANSVKYVRYFYNFDKKKKFDE